MHGGCGVGGAGEGVKARRGMSWREAMCGTGPLPTRVRHIHRGRTTHRGGRGRDYVALNLLPKQV